MKIQYQLTEAKLLEAMRFVTRKLSKRGKRAVGIYACFGVIFLIFSLYMLWSFHSEYTPLFSSWYFHLLFKDTFALILIIGFFSGAIAFFVNAYKFPGDFFKKWAKKPINQTLFLQKSVTLNDIGINFIDSNGNDSTVAWQTFGRVLQIDNFFFLEIQEDLFIILPKLQMTPEEAQYIDEALKQYVNNRYQH